jgi:dUTP pyrophosphatase
MSTKTSPRSSRSKTGTTKKLSSRSKAKKPKPNPNLVLTQVKVDPATTHNGHSVSFMPHYQTEGSACCDLIANCPPDVSGQRRMVLPPRSSVVVDCGFSMAVPTGYKACISARSGHAKAGLLIPNAPGQIDSDFRGRVQVLLTNISRQILVVEHGERFAQMWLEPVFKFEWSLTDELPETQRGEGGWGSTGKK